MSLSGYGVVAEKYALEIVSGDRLINKEMQQACSRFLGDLKESKDYLYDNDKADKACKFIEKMPHTKDRWARRGETLKLEPWQIFIVCNIFGWVTEKGFRRFRSAYLKIPRKNGKSVLAAAIGHYMLSADVEYGAEIYSGATTEAQAWEVFKPARLMALKTPEYTDYYGIEVNAKTITIETNGSVFRPIIGNPGDGASPSCAIIDELHEHKTSAMVDTMLTGMVSREQPLLLMITTAGNDISSPCFDTEKDAKKVLDGIFHDDTLFIAIFGIDEDDDWTTIESLKKANPNYGVSITEDALKNQLAVATRNPAKQNAYLRKHLNKWVGAHVSWLDMTQYKNCIEDMQPEDFAGEDCLISVDLASKIDITATPLIFTKEIDDDIHYYVFNRFFIPEATVAKPENDHLQKWVNSGDLIATEGNEIDFNDIETELRIDMQSYGVSSITYDPWRATQLAQRLGRDGANIVEFRNTVANMSPAMYELEAAIHSGRFHVDSNNVLEWMFSNVVAKIDAKDCIYPRKDSKINKIDGVVAIIMGIGEIMTREPPIDIDKFLDNPIYT